MFPESRRIRIYNVLNATDLPEDVFVVIVFHEMLHLEIPPVWTRGSKWNMHPREFWEAEHQRSPNYDSVLQMNVPTAESAAAPIHWCRPGCHAADAGARALYQVATCRLSADEISAPTRFPLRKRSNAEVLMAEVTGFDLQPRAVRMGAPQLHYDYLIVVTGTQYNYFGHNDWPCFADL